MSWLRIDDTFYDHPKIVAAGPLAVALHVFAMTYASRHGTDGFVPASMLPWLVRFDGIQLTLGLEPRGPAMPVDVQAIAARLVEIGLWHPADAPCARCRPRTRRPAHSRVAGYLIHDFLEYNPTSAEVDERRADNRERQRRWRAAHRGPDGRFTSDRHGEPNALLTPPRPDPARPVPVPNYVGTSPLTPDKELKMTVRAVIDEWRKARTRPGLERFTDPQAINGLKIRTKSALASGATFQDLRVAIIRHAHDPKANPWYIDEWAREIRAAREEADHVARKAQERRELDAVADRQRGLRPLGAILEDARRRSADG